MNIINSNESSFLGVNRMATAVNTDYLRMLMYTELRVYVHEIRK